MNQNPAAEHGKHAAALSSVLAAVGLTGMKLAVGLVTGSLGILAEAAHSGLDLVAAVVTLFAVKISDKPADADHLYGHGKVENLSALIETLLLLLTCVWIIYEAVERIFFKPVEVPVNFWSFAVIIVSITVDVSRSRMLMRAAKKYNSQALEADALHFSTDIWSSAVVLGGLVCMKLSALAAGLHFLKQADAVAALMVAMIVVWVSLRLGGRTVQELLDRAPDGMSEKIKQAVEAMPGVEDCHNVRIRPSGPQLFVDIHVTVDGAQPLAQAHDLTERIEEEIRRVAPGADVTVHPEPKTVAAGAN
jgi:cation diffusion facilitator family transporter